MTEDEQIKTIASAIAKAHILTNNATFKIEAVNNQQTKYITVVSHSMLANDIEEVISIEYMPFEVAKEYVHCRVHGLAAKLLAKLHPEKP